MARLNLTGQQTKALRLALSRAFDLNDLAIFLYEELDQRLADITPVQERFPVILSRIVERAEQQAWTSELILGAVTVRSRDPDLLRLARELGASSADSSGPGALQLEKLITKSNVFADVETFLGKLTEAERRVCRVECPNTRGTGILVAPDLVLTNFHVIEAIHSDATALAKVVCRFDFRTMPGNGAVREGTLVSLARDPIVSFSPYSRGDTDVTAKPAGAGELDYALLRLSEATGDELIGGAAAGVAGVVRGFFHFENSATVVKDEHILVLQHPSGQPLKLAIGTVLDSPNPVRLRHSANTEGGSSGSPCFNLGLGLVGVHHAGDPYFPGAGKGSYNQAIPAQLIAAALRSTRN